MNLIHHTIIIKLLYKGDAYFDYYYYYTYWLLIIIDCCFDRLCYLIFTYGMNCYAVPRIGGI